MAKPGGTPRKSSGAVVPPIELSTTFVREADGSFASGYLYTRHSNPNRAQLEAALCTLEHGAEALSFASGMAASMAALLALQSGDHLILPRECYHGTLSLVHEIFPRWGLAYSLVDMTDIDAIKGALTPRTKMLWIETPSNPCLRLSDLAAIAELAHTHGAYALCDNTVASPLNQNPLLLGCDVVLHSTTKYINGHSDVLGGALVTRERGPLAERLRTIQVCGGGVPAPFDCWLTSRSLATLNLRVREQNASALKIAEFLQQHANVTHVHYPWLPSHPQYDLARTQMRGGGGVVSFQVKGGERAAQKLVAQVQNIHRATSLGGVETLIEHRASMEREDTPTPRDLVRISIGLESTQDIIDDLANAFSV